jgi:hypothetical protein
VPVVGDGLLRPPAATTLRLAVLTVISVGSRPRPCGTWTTSAVVPVPVHDVAEREEP